MSQQMRSAFITRAWMICLTLVVGAGWARSTLAAMFVAHDTPSEIDMFRLVEAPPGHLSGSFVISSLDHDGSRKKDAIYDVTGSINGSNISLQLSGGLMSLAHFLGASAHLVGSLKGAILTLSYGNSTTVFHEMPQQQYEATLATLDRTGQRIAIVERANKLMQAVGSNDQRLNADLKNYIAWGQARMDRVPGVQRWYDHRITRYTKCLRFIRPLAAARVPAWRWQACVVGMETDQYYREQEAESIRDLARQNQKISAKLKARIGSAQQQFSRALRAMDSACPYAQKPDACRKIVQRLKLLSPGGFLDSDLVAAYRDIVPRVDNAIRTDAQISRSGESRLSDIAQQVNRLYDSAM